VLIAEEFLLLCLDEVSGRRSISGEKIDPALGGALLVELALRERIGITPASDGWRKRGRITITSTDPTDDDVLDDALAYLVAKEGKKAKDVISPMAFKPLTKGLRERLLERLARAGVLTKERGTVLGLIPTTSWPTADPTAEREVRARLWSALVDGQTPTERTVALIALLTVTGHLKKAVPGEDPKLVKQRAKALTEGDWAAQAVKQALDELHAAMAAGAAGGATGGSS
jgi:hypothetical protein